MPQKRIAPYGSWKSPITATAIASESFGLAQVAIDGDDLYWTETRPWEGGRSVIARQSAGGETTDVTPAGFNVRNRVHEYGGGAFAVHDGVVYFTNDSDRRVYAHRPGEAPTPLTPDDARRYADLEVDRRHNRILCVCEDHSQPDAEPTNTVVGIDIACGGTETIAQGNDFYSSPRVSPNGDRVCWLAWDHPNMPWDETELWVADVDSDGQARAIARLVAGDAGESIGEPQWSPDGTLFFVSDRTGWWNLYRWDGGNSVDEYLSDGGGVHGAAVAVRGRALRVRGSRRPHLLLHTGRLLARRSPRPSFRPPGAVQSPVHGSGARGTEGRERLGGVHLRVSHPA